MAEQRVQKVLADQGICSRREAERLIAAGKVGVAGSLVVVFLMALAGVSGWMIGIQMRVKIEHDRAWMKGYRDGRESSLPPITVTTERMLIRYRENPGL